MEDLGLFVDLYELTMREAYRNEGMEEPATFELFVRELPRDWQHVVACGLTSALDAIERFRFGPDAIAYLGEQDLFSDEGLDALASWRFTGDVRAMPEGTVAFAHEPLLQVDAPIPDAQMLETVLLNQIHMQTLHASKAGRVVEAADGRDVLDFGLRRIHGYDAGLRSARAFWIGGVSATSNVAAGHHYGLPLSGTMAHSYVQAHADERAALRGFAATFPDTVLLVDTYDTVQGIEHVVALADELGDDFRVRAIRLDSGDLANLARRARTMLDDAGLAEVRIYASGGLNEYTIERLVASGAPIDGFGVGSHLGTPRDAPSLDMVYKLVAYDGRPTRKTSTDKQTLPGRKQVWRRKDRDILGLDDEEDISGEPLLETVLERGRSRTVPDHHAARERHAQQHADFGRRHHKHAVEHSDGLVALMRLLASNE